MLELNKLYNMDCMQGMKEFPDGFFDLAIVDPPYGIGIDGQKKRVCGNPKHNRKEHIRKSWDKAIPPPEYFRELERVSKAQVIWGGNYFVPYLEQGHKGWLVWDKGQHGLTMSDCELAYTSFDTPTRVFVCNRVELLNDGTIHPTQKPVKLYSWVLYACRVRRSLFSSGLEREQRREIRIRRSNGAEQAVFLLRRLGEGARRNEQIRIHDRENRQDRFSMLRMRKIQRLSGNTRRR